MEEHELSQEQIGPAHEQRLAESADEEGFSDLKVVSPPVSPSPEEYILQTLQPLFAEITGLRRDFEAKVKYDASKERVIESLHRELQTHQHGLHFHVLQPLFLDLIALYDDLGKSIAWMEQEIPPVSERVVRQLRIFQETTEEILRCHGVESFTVAEEVFVPNKQRSIKVTPTSDAALDKHIARRVRPGFLYEEKLLRHELVEIYKYISGSEESSHA